MVRRGKQKEKAESSSSTVHNEHHFRQAGRRRQPPHDKQRKVTPKLVDEVNDSDDEEIPEDEAFNSEDERLYGHFFANNGASHVVKSAVNLKKKTANLGSSGDEVRSDDELSYKDAPGDSNGDDDDDDSLSEEEEDDDDDDDGGQYMLELLNKLDDPSRRADIDDSKNEKLSLAQMVKIPESDYSNSISKNGLTLENLMEGIQDTVGYRELQHNFSKEQKATPAPLDKVVASRVERRIAYEITAKDVSRWTKVIQENRQAESLDFKPKERLHMTRDTMVDKFEPKTDFEKEIEQALEEAGQQDEAAVLKAEEDALQDDLGANRLTMEEYTKRRGQLAQIRALMFYHEQKRHHMKKIKSKKYRRIRKKQRERAKESALEAAVEDDEDLANELKEKEEVLRIQERMTLAHRNTSKWAKRILKRGKNVDMDTRRALSAQLKRGDDLRRKMMGEEENDDGVDDSESEDLIESARQVLQDTEEGSDPTQTKAGLFKLSFMQRGIQKQRDQAREEARKLISELEANEFDDYDEVLQKDVDVESLQREIKIASEKEMKQVLEKGELVAVPLEFGYSNSIATNGGIEIDLAMTAKRVDVEGNDHNVSKTSVSATLEGGRSEYVSMTRVVQRSPSANTKPVPHMNKDTSTKNARKEEREFNVSMAVTKSDQHDSGEVNPWISKADGHGDSKKKMPSSKRGKGNGIVDIEGAMNILDSEKETKESGLVRKSQADGSPADRREQPKPGDEKKITMLSQEELVRKAFVGQNAQEVLEEFQREKEAVAAENDPTRLVETDKKSDEVAGWGSWTGEGSLPPKARRLPKKLQAPTKNKDEKRKRVDDTKPDVIINQKRLKKTANNFMLGDVPHPYASRSEYEQAMLGGVGKEWTVSSSFKTMTRPEILTRSGKIIQPISKRAKQPRPAAKF